MTGAGRGFGAGVVDALTDSGWDVIGVTRSPVRNPRRDAAWVHWDVTDDDASAVTSELGDRPLDLLVNNAGRGMPGSILQDIPVQQLLAVLDVNVGGVIRATQALLPNLLKAEQPIVINVSSRLGSLQDQAGGHYDDLSTSYAYRIAKAAQNMATICLAAEFGAEVKVVALHPGELTTKMGQATAKTEPRQAGEALARLLQEIDLQSPAFVRLTGEAIRW